MDAWQEFVAMSKMCVANRKPKYMSKPGPWDTASTQKQNSKYYRSASEVRMRFGFQFTAKGDSFTRRRLQGKYSVGGPDGTPRTVARRARKDERGCVHPRFCASLRSCLSARSRRCTTSSEKGKNTPLRRTSRQVLRDLPLCLPSWTCASALGLFAKLMLHTGHDADGPMNRRKLFRHPWAARMCDSKAFSERNAMLWHCWHAHTRGLLEMHGPSPRLRNKSSSTSVVVT